MNVRLTALVTNERAFNTSCDQYTCVITYFAVWIQAIFHPIATLVRKNNKKKKTACIHCLAISRGILIATFWLAEALVYWQLGTLLTLFGNRATRTYWLSQSTSGRSGGWNVMKSSFHKHKDNRWPVRRTESFLVLCPWHRRHFGDVRMKRGKRAHNAVMSSWNKC